jgi:hypothetical protein
MALVDILNINKDDGDFSDWAFVHYQDHLDIRSAIQTQNNINLEIQNINQINLQDVQGWLERHQLMHNDFNGILGLQGNDLTVVDFDNPEQRQVWLWLNFREHFDARAALKI